MCARTCFILMAAAVVVTAAPIDVSHETTALRGKKYFLYSGSATLADARASCANTIADGIAGRLAAPFSREENDALTSLLYYGGGDSAWLGGERAASTSTWTWHSAASAVTFYEGSACKADMHCSGSDFATGTTKAQLVLHHSGQWVADTTNGATDRPYACEFVHREGTFGVKHFRLLATPVTLGAAKTACSAEIYNGVPGLLAAILHSNEDTFAKHLLLQNDVTTAWLAMERSGANLRWLIQGGDKQTFFNTADTQPNRRCVGYYCAFEEGTSPTGNGTGLTLQRAGWNFAADTDLVVPMCTFRLTEAVVDGAKKFRLLDGVVRNLKGAPAVTACANSVYENRRGAVAIPHAAGQARVLVSLITNYLQERCWVGANDVVTEGQWITSAGHEYYNATSNECRTAYCFWRNNEPNNWGSGENYAEVWAKNDFVRAGTEGLNDISGATERQTVCEYPFDKAHTPTKYFQLINSEPLTFLDARHACRTRGMRLATVATESEQDALVTLWKAQATEDAAGLTIWLGGLRHGGVWFWLDVYERGAVSAPMHDGTSCVQHCKFPAGELGSDGMGLSLTHQAQWKPVSSSDKHYPMCEPAHSHTASFSLTPQPTVTHTPTSTIMPTMSNTVQLTSTHTVTVTVMPTRSPTLVATPTRTASSTLAATKSLTVPHTDTHRLTSTPTHVATPSRTFSMSRSVSRSTTATITTALSATATPARGSVTATKTASSDLTGSVPVSKSGSLWSVTPVTYSTQVSSTHTIPETASATATLSHDVTRTAAPTATQQSSASVTVGRTPSLTRSGTPLPTPSGTLEITLSVTATATQAPTRTAEAPVTSSVTTTQARTTTSSIVLDTKAGLGQPRPFGDVVMTAFFFGSSCGDFTFPIVPITVLILLILVILRLFWSLFRRCRGDVPANYATADVGPFKSLTRVHVWAGAVVPPHHYAGVAHMLLLAAHVLCIYAIVAIFVYHGDSMWRVIVSAIVASIGAALLHALLRLPFHHATVGAGGTHQARVPHIIGVVVCVVVVVVLAVVAAYYLMFLCGDEIIPFIIGILVAAFLSIFAMQPLLCAAVFAVRKQYHTRCLAAVPGFDRRVAAPPKGEWVMHAVMPIHDGPAGAPVGKVVDDIERGAEPTDPAAGMPVVSDADASAAPYGGASPRETPPLPVVSTADASPSKAAPPTKKKPAAKKPPGAKAATKKAAPRKAAPGKKTPAKAKATKDSGKL